MSKTISFPSGGANLPADLYKPTGGTPSGAVVIAYGSDGLTDHLNGPWKTMIEDFAASLVDEGFVVLVPDYLTATKTPPGPLVLELIFTEKKHWQRALSDAVDFVKGLPEVDASRVGLLGFSLGGHLSLCIRNKAQVLVAFYPPALQGIGSPGNPPHVQIHHGKDDKLKIENSQLIVDKLAGEGVTVDFREYDNAGHGFDGADAANTKARTDSKALTLSFFKAHL